MPQWNITTRERMFKTLLVLFIAYLLWKIVRIVIKVFRSGDQGYNRVHGTSEGSSKPSTHTEITDADFEEIEPKKKKDK